MAAPDLVNLCRCPDRVIQGVVRSGRFIGCTESGQSGANQGIPGFACNPDLDHALSCSPTPLPRHSPAPLLAPVDAYPDPRRRPIRKAIMFDRRRLLLSLLALPLPLATAAAQALVG